MSPRPGPAAAIAVLPTDNAQRHCGDVVLGALEFAVPAVVVLPAVHADRIGRRLDVAEHHGVGDGFGCHVARSEQQRGSLVVAALVVFQLGDLRWCELVGDLGL